MNTDTKTPIPTPLTDADLHAQDEQNQYITASLARRIERALIMANQELAQARAENERLRKRCDRFIEQDDALRTKIAALVAAGDAMREAISTLRAVLADLGAVGTMGNACVVAWDAAKAGAPADLAKELAELRADKARMDWMIDNHYSLSAITERYDDHETLLFWQVTKGKKSVSGHPSGDARDAIKEAMARNGGAK